MKQQKTKLTYLTNYEWHQASGVPRARPFLCIIQVSSQTIRVNVRVVAATNQDLGQLVANKQFRPDLYYRLNVIPIYLPALRERSEDIPLFVEYFVRKLSERLNRPIDLIPDEVMAVLKAHDWPGNIRELQNVIERSMVLSQGPVLRPGLTELKHMTRQPSTTACQTLADAEREHILGVLKQTDWLIGGQHGAATRLGLARTTLTYKMQKLGIEGRKRSRPSLHEAPLLARAASVNRPESFEPAAAF